MRQRANGTRTILRVLRFRVYVRDSNQAHQANEQDAEQRSGTVCGFENAIVVQGCHFQLDSQV